MKKTKLFRPLTIYFLVMAGIFLCVLLGGVFVYFSNPENFFAGNPDTFITYCVVFGGGAVIFLLPAVCLLFSSQKWRNGEKMRNTGICREMVVVDLEVDPNSKDFGYVVCQDPEEQEKPKRYKSIRAVYTYCVKKCPIGSIVPVYFDSQDPEHYFVDVDCARLDKEQLEVMCEGTELEQTIEDNCIITFENCHPEDQESTAGWVFCLIGLGILYVSIFGNTDSLGSRLGFGFIGVFIMAIGILIIYGITRQRKLSVLVETGMRFQANLYKVERNNDSRKSASGTRKTIRAYDLYFSGQNPVTGKEEKFLHHTRKPKITEDRVESGTVNVYVNPEKPTDIFWDISSCVLRLKG